MKKYMELALRLAAEWRGFTSPNPMVGAMVVKDGKIVGKGAHKKAGGPHAEVYALDEAGELARGGTLYVTLEPCSHYGKTPPCTEKIIASGIKKVVAAMEDPNPLVAGRGLTRLKEAGIEVEVGLCEKEARKLNEVFIKYITTRKPFVILKAAITLDGKIASVSGDSKWITNELSRIKVHQLRNQVDAVLVGKGTLLSDNPRLNVRLERGEIRNPQKIVLTSSLDIEPAQLKEMAAYQLSTEKPLIMVGAKNLVSQKRVEELEKMGIDVILLSYEEDGVDLEQLLIALGEREITSLLLEGGSGVYTRFLKAGLVDKAYIFQAPIIIGDEGLSWVQKMGFEKIDQGLRLKDVEYEPIADNILTIGYF
ncbi:riboflavin biosynthesis protein RibD [Anoxybacter fermentans]|uniref:Riboflavin biosynthesis protein RibD n=1 Tax=Anoxybacter fermentans TaxID=1323375 RepID=A0A3S9SXE3_9FIRM|nr:bifunctional diaminohydroxyphosphoribosylaminopyrimidine deaminase/5-amino-6-(5-phosphoribosylamino)uracil reductase RibD [Anoxybacter fermentans]AZR72955.1 riboflavin biosynthesis protein RibD [Anoxybacter fermentans]